MAKMAIYYRLVMHGNSNIKLIKDKYIGVAVSPAQLELHDRTKRIISHFKRAEQES